MGLMSFFAGLLGGGGKPGAANQGKPLTPAPPTASAAPPPQGAPPAPPSPPKARPQRMAMDPVPADLKPGDAPPPGWKAVPEEQAGEGFGSGHKGTGAPAPPAPSDGDFKHPGAWDPARPPKPPGRDDLGYDPTNQPMGREMAVPPEWTSQQAGEYYASMAGGQSAQNQPDPIPR